MRFLLSTALGLVLFAPAATAQLTGHTVTADWYYPSFGASLESHNVVVGAGTELPNTLILNDTKFDIDIGDDYVQVSFNALSNWTATSFNGWHFTDTNGTIAPISNYVLDSWSAGIGGTAGISTGFTGDTFWMNMAGMTVAGPGDWVRFSLDVGGPQLTVTNLVGGGTAVFTVDGATSGGSVGLAYSLNGGGPTTVNTGACGMQTVELTLPFGVLGIFSAIGTTMTHNQPIPGSATGLTVWFQGLDFGSCTMTNGVSMTVL